MKFEKLLLYIRHFVPFFFLAGAFSFGALFYVLQNKCIDFSVLERYDPGSPSILLDEDGKEWGRFQLEKREPILVSQMPHHLIQAFIAAEDWYFFTHHGISWRGIVRSLLVNIYSGRIVQGASTITQQLVKLLFFDAKKTLGRKIKEQMCAVLAERQFTKEQILQTYLNHVYFGCGIYGVEAASQKFWGKQAQDLTVDEAAVLAGIVRSPAHYCPLLCPLSAQKRRNSVLRKMAHLSFIDKLTYEQATQKSITVNEPEFNSLAPHLKESIRLFLEDLVGKEKLYSGGLTIKTTMSQAVQRQAEQAFSKQIAILKKKLLPDIDGSLISLDVKTGAIRALIGGYDFSSSKFNRALQAKRQIGSVLKPVIYAVALQQGGTFADIEYDEPLEMTMSNGQIWAPKNFNLSFDGRVSLAYALYHSSNIVAIKTLLQVGYEPVIALAKKCRIAGPFKAYPSLALGCVDGTLQDIAGMFNVFANSGVYVAPYYISWVKDKWGTKLYRARLERERVLSPRITGQVAKVLMLALKRVRQWLPQKWVDSEAISKTGTTNDCRTCWYVGSTPTLTTAVYIGCDDNRSLGKHIYPLRTSFPIWMGLNRELKFPQKKFSFDPSLKELLIHEKTGKRMHKAKDPNAITIFV